MAQQYYSASPPVVRQLNCRTMQSASPPVRQSLCTKHRDWRELEGPALEECRG